MRKPLLALLDISLLTPCAFLLTSKAYQVDPRTAYCLVPYCAWLSYATYLNGKLACTPPRATFSAPAAVLGQPTSCRTIFGPSRREGADLFEP